MRTDNILKKFLKAVSLRVAILVVMIPGGSYLSQAQEIFPPAQTSSWSFSLKGSFTVSSKLFLNIRATDELLRSQYLALDDIFGVGIDIRKMFEETSLQIGVSAEYLSVKEVRTGLVGSTRVPIEHGYWTVPIELSGYFVIPFSSTTFRLYIGGGAGVYLGERRYAVAEEQASITDKKTGLGIHVVTGGEYSILPWLGVRSELKFRDLQFETTHTFERGSVVYRGTMVTLDQTPTRSRVNVDGMVLDAGIVIRF